MSFLIKIFLCISVSLTALVGQADVFLRIEHPDASNLRYYVGDKLEFRTLQHPDVWRLEKILKFIPEEDIMITDAGYLYPHELHSTRYRNRKATNFGNLIFSLGAGVVVYGGIGQLYHGEYQASIMSVLIGSIVAGVGYALKKLFGYKKVPLNNNLSKAKIIDSRFSVPDSETPQLPIRSR